ncbi:MAG: hypothetical protein EHM45_14375 [Desulfobacteraceae bacterium]|nr:MAG: hypothetical protein EHM45_14375 [Desulfobacteraceae bacterium]
MERDINICLSIIGFIVFIALLMRTFYIFADWGMLAGRYPFDGSPAIGNVIITRSQVNNMFFENFRIKPYVNGFDLSPRFPYRFLFRPIFVPYSAIEYHMAENNMLANDSDAVLYGYNLMVELKIKSCPTFHLAVSARDAKALMRYHKIYADGRNEGSANEDLFLTGLTGLTEARD